MSLYGFTFRDRQRCSGVAFHCIAVDLPWDQYVREGGVGRVAW